MAKTGIIYRRAEELRDLACEAFTDLEANDELDSLIPVIDQIVARSVQLRDVAMEANASLEKLA